MFEKASRLGLRFDHKGLSNVEELWVIPLNALDTVFRHLNTQYRQKKEESLLNEKTAGDTILELKICLVRYIFKVRIQEQQMKLASIAKSDKKQKLLGIIAAKQDAELHGMSIEDLTKLVDEL